MPKITIKAENDPVSVWFEGDGQAWNINPGDDLTVTVQEGFSLEVEENNLIHTKGLPRPQGK